MSRKKKNIILGSLIGVLTIIVCLGVFFIGKGFNKEESLVYELNINELRKKIDNQDTFILIIEREGCSQCESYLPVVKKVSKKYSIAFYTIDNSKVSGEDATYLKNVANISGTPTTIFIVNGEEKTTTNRLVGEVPEYKLISRLKSEGYISE